MRRFERCSVLGVMLLLAATASAQDASYVPLDPLWDFEGRLVVRGKVTSVDEEYFPVDPKTRKPKDKPFATRQYTYRDGRLVGETGIGYDDRPIPAAEVKYKDGRRHQIVRTDGDKVTTQTAVYDANGRLQSVVITGDAEERTIDIAVAATDDGGYSLSWEGLSMIAGNERGQIQRSMNLLLNFNKAGTLIGRGMVRGDSVMMPTRYQRDDRGEIQTATHSGGKGDVTITYERDYDEHGNWTRQTATRSTGAEKVPQEVRTRKLTYAK